MPAKEFICSICNVKFNSKRSDAKYCSNKCRQKEHRGKNKLMQKPMHTLNTLHENIDHGIEDFFNRVFFPLEPSPKDFLSNEIYFLSLGLGIEKEFFKDEYRVIDTEEKAKKQDDDIERLKKTIIDKWLHGTEEERERIFRCYITNGASNKNISDIYFYLFNE